MPTDWRREEKYRFLDKKESTSTVEWQTLQEFQTRYPSSPDTPHSPLTRWGVFHYVYAVLHHLQYRERYAANLRCELPRIPFVAQASPPASSGSVSAPRKTAERGRSANSQPETAALQADAALSHVFATAARP